MQNQYKKSHLWFRVYLLFILLFFYLYRHYHIGPRFNGMQVVKKKTDVTDEDEKKKWDRVYDTATVDVGNMTVTMFCKKNGENTCIVSVKQFQFLVKLKIYVLSPLTGCTIQDFAHANYIQPGNRLYRGFDELSEGAVLYFPKARRNRRIQVEFDNGKSYMGKVLCNDMGTLMELPRTRVIWDDDELNHQKKYKKIKLEDGKVKFIN